MIDIGSNSIRLVVFERPDRAPQPVFNERVFCGLGRGIAESGRLDADSVAVARTNIARYVRLAEAIGSREVHLIATAAVRDAGNGAQFVADVEKQTGRKVQVIAGADEARYSALGVIAGTPEADGFMGDLGGGSLELTQIKDGNPGASVTLTIGSLRLLTGSHGDRRVAREEVDRQLEAVPWLETMRGRTLYAVGGTWRSIARLDMELRDYPMHVIHGYIASRKQMEALAQFVERLGRKSLSGITSVPRRRHETLPFGALALTRLLRLTKPKRVVFSSYGLREGFLFDRLDAAERRADPLVSGALRMAQRESRFPDFGSVLADWIAPLFSFESPEERRLRIAACHLSDIGWMEHPDYRAIQAFLRVARSSLVGIDHPGRAFVAGAVLTRYGGEIDHPDVAKVLSLLDKETVQRARGIGAALRLGYTLSGGADNLLRRTSLTHDRDEIRLKLPTDGSVPVGEAVERHLESLAKALDAKRGRLA